jgi:hypothetical protein
MGAKAKWSMPKKITGVHKRGIWEYEIGDAKNVELDNGLVYTPADYKVFMESRKNFEQPKPVAA